MQTPHALAPSTDGRPGSSWGVLEPGARTIRMPPELYGACCSLRPDGECISRAVGHVLHERVPPRPVRESSRFPSTLGDAACSPLLKRAVLFMA